MAQKCAACGSADTTTGAGSHSCLTCGVKTAVGPVEFDNDTRPVRAGVKKAGGPRKASAAKKG